MKYDVDEHRKLPRLTEQSLEMQRLQSVQTPSLILRTSVTLLCTHLKIDSVPEEGFFLLTNKEVRKIKIHT